MSIKILDIKPAGLSMKNLSKLLVGRRFKDMIKELELSYDYIIFDSAPIGSFIDTTMLLRYVDTLLLTVRVDMSYKSYIEQFNKMVNMNSIKSVGFIINGVKISISKSSIYNYPAMMALKIIHH